MPSFSVVRSYL